MATFSIGKNDEPVKGEFEQEILKDCPRKGCGGVLVKRINGKTKEVFYACTNWKVSDGGCKTTADSSGNVRKPKRLKKLGKCPKCKGTLVERTSRQGSKFKACDRFPACKHTESI